MAAQAFESKDSRESPLSQKFNETFNADPKNARRATASELGPGVPTEISTRVRASGRSSTHAMSIDPNRPPTTNKGGGIDSVLSCISFELGPSHQQKSIKGGSRSI